MADDNVVLSKRGLNFSRLRSFLRNKLFRRISNSLPPPDTVYAREGFLVYLKLLMRSDACDWPSEFSMCSMFSVPVWTPPMLLVVYIKAAYMLSGLTRALPTADAAVAGSAVEASPPDTPPGV